MTALAAAAAAVLATWAMAEILAERERAEPSAPRTALAASLVGLVRGLGRRFGSPAAPRDLRGRIAVAGLDPQLAPADVMALKGGAVMLALVLLMPLTLGLPGSLVPMFVTVVPAAAFLLPDQVLRVRARRRAAVLARELADVLDLLRVAVAAGLPITRAIEQVGRCHPGLLAREFRRTAGEIAVGVRHRDALAALAERCPSAGVGALVGAIERCGRHGAPLAPALAALAADARADRARILQDNAAKAAPKIQLVIALLLVPSVLLLVGAALLSSFTTG